MAREMQVFVRFDNMCTTRTLTLNVTPRTLIIELKKNVVERIEEAGLQESSIQVTFAGKPLMDHLPLYEYNIHKESTLFAAVLCPLATATHGFLDSESNGGCDVQVASCKRAFEESDVKLVDVDPKKWKSACEVAPVCV
eukprot:comp15882_c0_seq1/m.13231 comp15882_c0_seq1/g.13231  ORF comp15882_c0_seq1/g.13231 comp15882_c0_seq1/m.13231 type:complete len:139 (-) comp15882_c0_seq1:440-856(-)